MQQVICTALDYLSHGDGLPGEEVGAAAGDAAGWGVGEAAGGRPGACLDARRRGTATDRA